MASLQLKLLGGFAASLPSGRPVELVGKKNQALLAYLAVNRGKRQSREKLMGLLWSDRGEAQARGSLRQALAALKEALAGIEPGPLVLDGDSVALNPAAVSTDVASFEQLAGSESADDLRQVAKLYEGDLLDEMAVPDPGFGDWLSAEQARLREAAIGAIGRLTAQVAGAEAIAMGKRLIALDPLREASHRALMQAYAAAGEKSLALQHYTTCRDLLKAELGVTPARETDELRQRILEGGSAPATSQAPGGMAPSPQKAIAIAVLPFTNMSDNPGQDYFSDGITEDIITELSRCQGLRVVARNSSFQYRDKSMDLRRIGQELGVEYLVEGSVRKAGNRLRITTHLIESESGSHLWAERYDRALEQIFEIQDEVVRAIAVAVPGQIERSRYDVVRSKRPENLTAYDYVLRGRWHWWHGTASHQELIDLFKKAVEIDPDCAPAHVGLARQYAFGVLTLGLDPEGTQTKARYHVERALAIDDNDAITHATAAGTYLQCGEHNLAAIHSNRAFLLNPNDTSVINTYGATLAYLGDPASGIEVLLASRQMLPHAPDDYRLELLFDCYYMAGDFAKAIETFQQIRSPVHHMHAENGAALALLGRVQEAQEAITASRQHAPAGWGLASYALNHSRLCKDKKHAELWLEGYRKAGIAV